MTTDPDPPTNVRVHLHDGRIVPVDCRYLERDTHGIDRWEAVTHVPAARIAKLTVDRLPARCAISVPLDQD